MKNIKKTAILLMVLGVAVLTGRCVSEEAGSEQKIEQSIKVSQARVWFEQYESKAKIDSSFKSQVYNWNSAITEIFENGTEALVVPVTDNNLSDAYKGQKVLYLYPLENKNDFSATLYEILPLSESLEKIKSSADLVNFNGYIIAWDLERGFVNGAKFENSNTTAALTGLRIISSEESERLNKSTAKSDPFELDEVIIRREKSENKQEYGGGGSAGGSYGGSLNSGSKSSTGGFVSAPGGGGNGSSGSTTSPNAQRIEEQISADKLDACTKAVLEKMKNLKQADLAKMLTRFNAAGSVFNINMSTGQVQNDNPNVWAQTTKTNGSNNDVNMVFNQDYIYGTGNTNPPTDLSVAATMAHEVIHAYLISLIQENKSCGASGICDFPTVYEAYVQYEITRNPNVLPDAQHELIANKYVNAIASTIQEFHTGKLVVSSSSLKQVYLDMAWAGLQKTEIFNKIYPNDPNNKNYKERERIFARITAERKGEQYGVTSPAGKPCKK
ncbi:hypothetical protein [Flavobacterium tructae]|uniref:hypothetical protein n=1 Tax=Flavobacterium tructae TaxID=1114873 RepID=UPI0035A94F03